MPDMTFNELVKGYAAAAKTEYMYNSVYSVLVPKQKIVDQKYNETKIREVSIVGGSIPYDGAYPTTGGAKINVNWVAYKYDFDGTYSFTDDSLDEIQSFVQGGEPSIFVGAKQYIGQVFAVETDKLCSAKFYSQIPEDNQLKDTFKNGFYAGLDEIEMNLTNAKVPKSVPVYVFVNASTYKTQAAEARQNMILANNVTVEIEQGGIVIKKDCKKYGRFIIIEVADDVMMSAYDQYDGKTPGQEAGGVHAAEDATQIQALIIPDGAGFVDNQYITSNAWYNPALMQYCNPGNPESNITNLIGDFVVNQCGPNPVADAFAIKGRIRNARSLYDINKKYCFSVVESAGVGG